MLSAMSSPSSTDCSKRIVYTRPDSCVSIVCPSMNAIRWMGSGGRWPHATRGWLQQQVERQIAAGHDPDVSYRHVMAMMLGGLTTAEALALIRDRDCAHRGTGIELWDFYDVPSDRWFRDAWRRSPDGGPIRTDLHAAKIIQQRKVVVAVKQHNAMQKCSPEFWGHNGPQIIEVDYRWIKRQCEAARSVEELRQVWPLELRVP